MRAEILRYRADGLDMQGFLARPEEKGARSGILIAPEGPGLGEHARYRAAALAECGHVVLAADLYGGGRVAASHEQTLEWGGALLADRSALRARMSGALAALQAVQGVDPDRLGAVGYCLGGLAVLELARSGAPVRGTVTFHGLLTSDNPDESRNIAGKLLVCTGSDDPIVPVEHVAAFAAEMSASGIDWQVITYGGARHGFTNRFETNTLGVLGFGYDAAADRRSWAAMQGFLAEALA